MKKNKGYKYKLLPSQKQIEYFEQCFGCSRKVYNLYVDKLYSFLESINYENGFIKGFKQPTPKSFKLEFAYLNSVDSLALCNAQLDFKGAIKKFHSDYDKKTYKKRAKKQEKTIGKILTFRELKGMPCFKSKKDSKQSFTTNNQTSGKRDTIRIINDCYIIIPKLKTPIKFKKHRDLPQNSIIKNVTISRSCGKYYISINIEYHEDVKPVKPINILGLDYSQRNFYVSSVGEKANYPHYYHKSEKRLIKEQRKLAKMELKSNNWLRQKHKISKLQEHIANQRKDWLHKKSHELAHQYDAISVEDIDLRSMAQYKKFGKNTHDNGFGMFRIFLQYKLEDLGKQLIKIDKWFPSSKKCSECGWTNEKLQLSDHIWTCKCGKVHERDYNAAINIKNEGLRLVALL